MLIIAGFIYINHEPTQQIRMDFPTINEQTLLKRPKIISKIDIALSSQKGIKIAVLTGPGGSGKTTIAREYAKSQNAKVIWEINAETENSLINSLNNLASELALTKETKEELSYIRAVSEQKEKHKRLTVFVGKQLKKAKSWCLHFDNVDNFNMIKDYFPFDYKVWRGGKIIITTRNENIKNVSYINDSYTIPIGGLDKEEQMTLFKNITNNDKTTEIANFVKNIPPQPLDISAAAYYIKNTGTSLEDYMKITNSSDNNQKDLVSDCICSSKNRYSIIASNFSDIIKQNPKFKELLLFICLVDSQNIPKCFLEKYIDKITSNEFIYNLKKHSLITENGDTFTIHRSTQEIGLKHVLGNLCEEDKTKCLNEIVKVVTPYAEMCWILHSSFKYKIKSEENEYFFPHLKNLYENISSFNFSKGRHEEFSTRILLGMAYCITDNINGYNLNELLEKVISKSNFIPSYENAVIFSELTYYYMYRNLELSFLYAKKAINCAKMLGNAQNLVVLNKSYIGVLNSLQGNFTEARKNIIYAWNNILENRNESWVKYTAPLVWYRLISIYMDNYINKKNSMKNLIISSIHDVIYISGLLEFFNDISQGKKSKNFALPIKVKLSTLYNRLDEYEKALESEKEALFLVERKEALGGLRDKRYRYYINSNYGYTLLRLNKIKQSYNILTDCINFHNKPDNSKDLQEVLVGRSEAKIRLGKINEAFIDSQEAIKLDGSEHHNYAKLLSCIARYHAAIIKYKQKDSVLSLKHFTDFFTRIDDFCKGFLDKIVYEKLVAEKTFEIVKNKTQIQKCLQNSLKIFTAIYGEKHSFVKDYVSENCKERSWIYEKSKIARHYFRYWIDFCVEFLSL